MKSKGRVSGSILADGEQPVSFAELFFDLVFVFSVTQVVHLLDGGLDWMNTGRAVLVFWLVWWAWTQYTWALNAADTRHPAVLTGILVATACVFFMAVCLPGAFSFSALWFAVAYVAVRCIGLLLYIWAAWTDPEMRRAVRLFGTFSIAGMIAVIIGGWLGGAQQLIFWGLAILLDVLAASFGGRSEGWNLHPMHFSERHGLFVIIALGETLIIAASGAVAEEGNSSRMIVSMLAMGVTAALWWLYFFRYKSQLEHAMAMRKGKFQSEMGRDVFSLLHFPILLGLIIHAYAIEVAILYPNDPLPKDARLALALGWSLFSITQVVAYVRATGQMMYLRLTGTLVVAMVCYLTEDISAMLSLSILLGGLILLIVIEERWRPVDTVYSVP